MAGGEPTPRSKMPGRLEAGDVTDLGDQDRRRDRADSVDVLDRVITGVIPEPVRDRRRELADLTVERVDQRHDRFDPSPERTVEPGIV